MVCTWTEPHDYHDLLHEQHDQGQRTQSELLARTPMHKSLLHRVVENASQDTTTPEQREV